MKTNRDDDRQELIHLWTLMDAETRNELLGYAKELSGGCSFIGGPFDGWRVSDDDRAYVVHTFDYGAKLMAVYCLDDRGRFVFDGIIPADDFENCTDKNEGGAQ